MGQKSIGQAQRAAAGIDSLFTVVSQLWRKSEALMPSDPSRPAGCRVVYPSQMLDL